jgi:hypothetical protein
MHHVAQTSNLRPNPHTLFIIHNKYHGVEITLAPINLSIEHLNVLFKQNSQKHAISSTSNCVSLFFG